MMRPASQRLLLEIHCFNVADGCSKLPLPEMERSLCAAGRTLRLPCRQATSILLCTAASCTITRTQATGGQLVGENTSDWSAVWSDGLLKPPLRFESAMPRAD